MKTRYKHILFEQVGDSKTWVCRNKKTTAKLGFVEYYRRWHRYVFEGVEGCVFDTNCLKDINDFIKQVENERRTPNAELRTPNFKLRTSKKMKMKDLVEILNKVEPQDAEVTAVMIGIEGEIKWRNEEIIETVEVEK